MTAETSQTSLRHRPGGRRPHASPPSPPTFLDCGSDAPNARAWLGVAGSSRNMQLRADVHQRFVFQWFCGISLFWVTLWGNDTGWKPVSGNEEIMLEVVAISSADRSASDPVPSRQRSRITNGRLLPGDNRGSWARRCRDLISEHLSDLGGEDNTSAAEQSLVRRAAVLTVELEEDRGAVCNCRRGIGRRNRSLCTRSWESTEVVSSCWPAAPGEGHRCPVACRCLRTYSFGEGGSA